jgi:hypothetical protein
LEAAGAPRLTAAFTGGLYVLGAGQHRLGVAGETRWLIHRLCRPPDRGLKRALFACPPGGNCTLRMLAEGLQSTRLETRTKESNMYASWWAENP